MNEWIPSKLEIVLMIVVLIAFFVTIVMGLTPDHSLTDSELDEVKVFSCQEGCVISTRIIWHDNITYYEENLNYAHVDCIVKCDNITNSEYMQ